MRKIFAIAIILVIVTLFVIAFYPPVNAAVVGWIGEVSPGVAALLSGIGVAIASTPIYQVWHPLIYFVVFGITWYAIFRLWSKRPKIFQKTTTESIQTIPFRQTTPTGATLRPTNATSESTPTSPDETVTKEKKEQ